MPHIAAGTGPSITVPCSALTALTRLPEPTLDPERRHRAAVRRTDTEPAPLTPGTRRARFVAIKAFCASGVKNNGYGQTYGDGVIKNVDPAYRRLFGALCILATLWIAGCGFPAMSVRLIRPGSGWVTDELAKCRIELNMKIPVRCVDFEYHVNQEMAGMLNINEGIARLEKHDFECEAKSKSTALCVHRSVWKFSVSAGVPRVTKGVFLKVLVVNLTLSQKSATRPVNIDISYNIVP